MRAREKQAHDASTCGLLIIDKPEGLTSFDVVARVKRWLRPKKVGHCGTLDPFATGVLILCLNQATRIVDQLSDQDKTYCFTVHFGVETDTLDRTGQVTRSCDWPAIPEEDLREVIGRFQGEYEQEVPLYSAVHVQGKRLHELARKGVEVERLPRRRICIHSIRLLEYHWPEARIEASCSKGAYVRQLAADIGRSIGCGAHVTELRRLASGPFGIDRAVGLDELHGLLEGDGWKEKLVTMEEALGHLPALGMSNEGQLKRLADGGLDPKWEAEGFRQLPAGAERARIIHPDGRLLALWWPGPEPGRGYRLRVFARDL